MAKRSLLQSIVKAKCPRCRQGDLFLNSAFNLRKFDKMPERCSVCDLRFEIEPGFFYGAMYVSYALTVGMVLVLMFFLYNVFDDPPTWVYILVIVATLIIPMTWVFRASRVLYIYFFSGIRYKAS